MGSYKIRYCWYILQKKYSTWLGVYDRIYYLCNRVGNMITTMDFCFLKKMLIKGLRCTLILSLLGLGMIACKDKKEAVNVPTTEVVVENVEEVNKCTVRSEAETLVVYAPQFGRIDLACSTMPEKTDCNVLLCAGAAFTGELLDEFKHSNILGAHVSAGAYYKGTPNKRCSGAFVWYDGKYEFVHDDHKAALERAAQHGGMGFEQEMMIHKGRRVPTTRKDLNKNEFRALCDVAGTLCIIDSKGVVAFGDFIESLLQYGATEALYLDMGTGWNYSWWRDADDMVHEIHNKRIPYTTNWITFYKN